MMSNTSFVCGPQVAHMYWKMNKIFLSQTTLQHTLHTTLIAHFLLQLAANLEAFGLTGHRLLLSALTIADLVETPQ